MAQATPSRRARCAAEKMDWPGSAMGARRSELPLPSLSPAAAGGRATLTGWPSPSREPAARPPPRSARACNRRRRAACSGWRGGCRRRRRPRRGRGHPLGLDRLAHQPRGVDRDRHLEPHEHAARRVVPAHPTGARRLRAASMVSRRRRYSVRRRATWPAARPARGRPRSAGGQGWGCRCRPRASRRRASAPGAPAPPPSRRAGPGRGSWRTTPGRTPTCPPGRAGAGPGSPRSRGSRRRRPPGSASR